MYHHVKKLMYSVNVGTPDVAFGNMLLEQFGGANGELAAAMPKSGCAAHAAAVIPAPARKLRREVPSIDAPFPRDECNVYSNAVLRGSKPDSCYSVNARNPHRQSLEHLRTWQGPVGESSPNFPVSKTCQAPQSVDNSITHT